MLRKFTNMFALSQADLAEVQARKDKYSEKRHAREDQRRREKEAKREAAARKKEVKDFNNGWEEGYGPSLQQRAAALKSKLRV